MKPENELEFIPFHAINEFMRNDFRLNVIRKTLLSLNELDRKYRAPIDQMTKKYVKVAGFRNSTKAPASVKAVAMVKAFEVQPKLVAAILEAWTISQPDFRQQVNDMLAHRGWKILPLDFNRSRLPGFLTRWPAEDDYDVLYDAFISAHPESEVSIDQTSLMIIWLAGRLPIDKISIAEMSLPDQLDNDDTDTD